jgi:hypothetical protein
MTDPRRPQDPVPGQPYGYPPQPGYYVYIPPPPPPGMVRPSNYLAWAIISIFLFWPVAIAAIVKSTQVDRLWLEGRYVEARDSSTTTRTLCLVATILGATLFVVMFLFVNLVFSQLPSHLPPVVR